MKIEKMSKQNYLQSIAKAFQEGDTLKWEDGYISHYGTAMTPLSEYNTETGDVMYY